MYEPNDSRKEYSRCGFKHAKEKCPDGRKACNKCSSKHHLPVCASFGMEDMRDERKKTQKNVDTVDNPEETKKSEVLFIAQMTTDKNGKGCIRVY